MRLVLSLMGWRGGSIARNGIVVPIMLFVVFEKVWMDVPDVYDLHVRRDVPELE
jgi:hypothetical protein